MTSVTFDNCKLSVIMKVFQKIKAAGFKNSTEPRGMLQTMLMYAILLHKLNSSGILEEIVGGKTNIYK